MAYATSDERKECSQEKGPRQNRQQLIEKTICGKGSRLALAECQFSVREGPEDDLRSKTQRKVPVICKEFDGQENGSRTSYRKDVLQARGRQEAEDRRYSDGAEQTHHIAEQVKLMRCSTNTRNIAGAPLTLAARR